MTQKTQPTPQQIDEFLAPLPPQVQADSRVLMKLMQEVTGEQPVIYTYGMIGFGHYHYKYESGHEGDSFKLGFAPRKDKFSIYLAGYQTDIDELLAQLGKHKMGKGCLYIKKLADVNEEVLKALFVKSLATIKERFGQ